MKLRAMIQITGGLTAVALALLLGAGCSSTGYEKGHKAAANIQEAANLIAALPAQIDKTLTSLDIIVDSPQADLRPQYKKFTSNLGELKSSAKKVADARAAMVRKTKAFFDKWNQQLATIQNEDIKTRSQSRKDEVATKFEAVSKSYGEASSAFRPFLSDLEDVQKYLSMDLTAGGVTGIRKTVARVGKSAEPVKKAVAQVADDFRALGLTLASAAPPPTQ